MAARRLLILMLLVLAISTLAAGLFASPAPEPRPATTATEPDRGPPKDVQGPGRLIEASVRTGARRPETIRLRVGDQLDLVVRSRAVAQIEIPRFGLIEDVAPGLPARFSILTPESGEFGVNVAGARRAVARVVVEKAGAGAAG